MQALLPGCNVAVMVQLQPQLFLSRSTQQLQQQVGTAYGIISSELPSDYVDAMVQVSLLRTLYCTSIFQYTATIYRGVLAVLGR